MDVDELPVYYDEGFDDVDSVAVVVAVVFDEEAVVCGRYYDVVVVLVVFRQVGADGGFDV